MDKISSYVSVANDLRLDFFYPPLIQISALFAQVDVLLMAVLN